MQTLIGISAPWKSLRNIVNVDGGDSGFLKCPRFKMGWFYDFVACCYYVDK